jgi:hypothetical protein
MLADGGDGVFHFNEKSQPEAADFRLVIVGRFIQFLLSQLVELDA